MESNLVYPKFRRNSTVNVLKITYATVQMEDVGEGVGILDIAPNLDFLHMRSSNYHYQTKVNYKL